MKTCIICRLPKENFNDEHVIPDSIGGYYHIYRVCTDCNSKLGSSIDSKLTNHKFIEFQRSLLNIKGKSGTVPEPFKGTHTLKDDPDQKVKLQLDENGEYRPVMLPKISDLSEGLVGSFSVVIDKDDEKNLERILDKLYKRNGIDPSKVRAEKTYHQSHPWVEMNLSIDIHEFKAGLLKIAYEFAVDTLPDYFNDKHAEVISKILLDADFKGMKSNIQFLGNGFDNGVMRGFENWIDVDSHNHYLVLVGTEVGLFCFVNLFNVLSIGIKMSDRTDYLAREQLYVGKNDLNKKLFTVYSLPEIINMLYAPGGHTFEYFFEDQYALFAFQAMNMLPEFDFYYQDGKLPLFDAQGNKIYDSVSEKLVDLPYEDVGEMDSKFAFDEPIYIKHLPSLSLYRVSSVTEKMLKKGKL